MGEFVFLLLPAAIIITVYDHYWGAGRGSSHVVPAGLIYSSRLSFLIAMKTEECTCSVFGVFTQNYCDYTKPPMD